MALDDAFDPEAGTAAEVVDAGQRTLGRGRVGDRRCDRMFGRRLDGTDDPKRVVAHGALACHHVDERHHPGGDGAGLVEHHSVEPSRRLEHLRASDEDAELRAAAGAGEEGGRGRESERARAHDDEDGDRRGEGSVGVARGDEPGDERDGCDEDDAGTNTADTRSASRCAWALPDCAWVTRRPICARAVSAPTRVASTTSRPPTLIVAPVTGEPGPTSAGRLSPVRSDASIAEAPSTTTPSVAIFSPGRTTKRSPTCTSSIGTSRSVPATSTTDAVLAPMSSSARRAEVA